MNIPRSPSYSPPPDPYDRWQDPQPAASFKAHLPSIVLGAFLLFITLEQAGYSVRPWLDRRLQMLTSTLRSRGGSDAHVDDENEDSAQESGSMLGSLFGLRSASLLQKSVRGVAGAFSRGSSDVPPGLGNISNSCYQNSIIQGLAALPALRTYLAKTLEEYDALPRDTTNRALLELLNALNDADSNGQRYWVRGKLNLISTFQQQDAQEYYSIILQELEKEVKTASTGKRKRSSSLSEVVKDLGTHTQTLETINENITVSTASQKQQDTSLNTQVAAPKVAPTPLDGLTAQRVGCISCGHSDGLSFTPFNCLTVPLGINHHYDIRDCLDEYTKLDYVTEVACAKCTVLKFQKTLTPLALAQPESPYAARLKQVEQALEQEDFEDSTLIKNLNIAKKNWVQSTKSTQIVIGRAPKCLVLHVNRSSFDERTGASYKNSANVYYPSVLDLGNWCLGSKPSDTQDADVAVEQWSRSPQESMLPDPVGEPESASAFQYQLRAAVTHYGSHDSGHYICYRPHTRSVKQDKDGVDLDSESGRHGMEEREEVPQEQWWRFSDDTVYAVPEEAAHQGNVFMLFYERIDGSTTILPRAAEPAATIIPSVEDAPLPPDVLVPVEVPAENLDAVAISLPDDDEDSLSDVPDSNSPFLDFSETAQAICPPSLPLLPQPRVHGGETLIYPTPPPEDADVISRCSTSFKSDHHDTEMSEAESEDAPSTLLTSDSEFEPELKSKPIPIPAVSPHLMRTAGKTAGRGQGKRHSPPLVSAT